MRRIQKDGQGLSDEETRVVVPAWFSSSSVNGCTDGNGGATHTLNVQCSEDMLAPIHSRGTPEVSGSELVVLAHKSSAPCMRVPRYHELLAEQV